jgi:hypothetical protein
MSAPRSQRNFRKRDMRVAVEAVHAAGVEVARVEVDKEGKIIVVAGIAVSGEAQVTGNESDNIENPWDRTVAELDDHQSERGV